MKIHKLILKILINVHPKLFMRYFKEYEEVLYEYYLEEKNVIE